jgi:hypothetical protein
MRTSQSQNVVQYKILEMNSSRVCLKILSKYKKYIDLEECFP